MCCWHSKQPFLPTLLVANYGQPWLHRRLRNRHKIQRRDKRKIERRYTVTIGIFRISITSGPNTFA